MTSRIRKDESFANHEDRNNEEKEIETMKRRRNISHTGRSYSISPHGSRTRSRSRSWTRSRSRSWSGDRKKRLLEWCEISSLNLKSFDYYRTNRRHRSRSGSYSRSREQKSRRHSRQRDSIERSSQRRYLTDRNSLVSA